MSLREVISRLSVLKLKSFDLSQKEIDLSVTKKLKGGALYISILVSIIIGIVLTLFILVGNYNQRNITVFSQLAQLHFNLKSGFEMAQSEYFTEEQNYHWLKNQVNDDSIRVKKMNWGAFLILNSETKNRHQYLSQSGLFGTYMSPDTGLIIADNSRPVGMSGNIVFKSACYLPRAGVKPAYIEGQSYISSAQNSGHVRPAPSQAPLINDQFVRGLKHQLNGIDIYLDSAVRILPEVCTQAFNKKTIVLETTLRSLSKSYFKNNIKIVCGDVEIDSSCHLDNILIVCNKVHFKKGFRGKVHVIARDSISMDEACTFDYPSSFVLLAEESPNAGFRHIYFNKSCKFYGGVLAINENSSASSTQKVFVKFHAASEVNGFIYSSDYIHLEGVLNATVVAAKLLLQTPSAVYENHMLGCEINPGKYGHLLAVPLVFKQRAKLLCCEMLQG